MKGNITGLFVLVILAFSAIERSFALDQDVTIRASWPPTSSGQPIRDLAAHNGYLFSISGYYRIDRYDFTDSANPRELTAIASDGLPIALTIEGNSLYVLDNLTGLRIFDLSDTSSPRLIGTAVVPVDDSKIAVSNGFAYAISGHAVLNIVDVREATNPKLVSALPLPGGAANFAVAGDFVYVTTYPAANTQIIDARDHANPQQIGNFDLGNLRAVAGKHLYTATQAQLHIYDLTVPATPTLDSNFDASGYLLNLQAEGDLVYAADSSGIVVIDTSAPQSPQVIGRYAVTSPNIAAMSLDDGHLYVDLSTTIEVVDVSAPSTPRLLGSSRNMAAGLIYNATLVGAYALAMDYYSASAGLSVVDFSNITNPVQVARVNTTRQVIAADVVGRYAYVTFGQPFGPGDGMGVIDLTDIRNPRLVDDQLSTNVYSHFNVVDNHVLALGSGNLTTLDLSDPLALRRVATLATSPKQRQLVVQGSRAFIAAGADGLLVIDVTDPLAPQLAGTFQTNVLGVAVRGSNAFLACGTNVVVLDVSNPAAMRVVGGFNDGQIGDAIYLDNQTAYVLGARPAVLDISDPLRPTLKFRAASLGSIIGFSAPYILQSYNGLEVVEVTKANPQTMTRLEISRDIRDVAVSGRYAYVASPQTNIQIIDISNSAAPQKIGEVGGTAATRVAASGRYLYAAGQNFQIIDVTDPQNPVITATLNERAQAIGISDKYAFLTSDLTREFVIVNVTNKSQPFVAGRTSGGPSLAVRWPYAYLGGDGIFIYDVSDPAQPKRAGSFSGFGTASELDVALDGNFVYSVGPFGLHVTDVSDPTTPRWLGSYKQHGFRARRVTAKGKYAYAIDYEGAMHVFDVSLPSQPRRVAGNVQINPSMQDNNPFAVGFGLFASADTLYVAAQNRFSIADIFHNDPAALRITSLQPIVPESARLRLSGPLNTAVGIETSPDLKTWSRLQPFTLGEVPTDIADPSVDSTTHFYRLLKD